MSMLSLRVTETPDVPEDAMEEWMERWDTGGEITEFLDEWAKRHLVAHALTMVKEETSFAAFLSLDDAGPFVEMCVDLLSYDSGIELPVKWNVRLEDMPKLIVSDGELDEFQAFRSWLSDSLAYMDAAIAAKEEET